MPEIGLVAGTVFYGLDLFSRQGQKQTIETQFGPSQVIITEHVVYIPRHGLDAQKYIFPHELNHRANMTALKSLGITEVVAVNSVGSLKIDLPPGTIVVPDDYILLYPVPTTIADTARHLPPRLSSGVQSKILDAAGKKLIPVIHGGVYWQTSGPRFETKAEIRLMKNFADLVGMTMASEAIVAQEVGLEYAAICSVDNYANGLIDTPLTEAQIRQAALKNSDLMITIVSEYLGRGLTTV
ncbi:MAG: MTAP family purine nucleoside phosphorylase [Deltaproteobacteria bacterium]|nr:MTAP family purine nucleoside phosphorylase [Deltaproteobacteria bacterium]MBF0524428.1 MTAP family purine nucleoside phosphorylase [Deltaproteobacteria bacterium]